MSPVNERQWQGRILLKLGELIAKRPELGFHRIEQEVEVKVGGQKRKYTDPLLYNGEDRPLCLLELKLPDRPDGRSPRYLPVVEATHEKASYMGAPYWVTWNVNSAVLWKLDVPGRPPHERSIRQYDVTSIRSSDDLDRLDVVRQIDAFLEKLLQDIHDVHVGTVVGEPQPLDESFVHTIQTYIDPLLVGVLQQELVVLYERDRRFAAGLRRWAVDDQGWTWDDSAAGLPESIGRTVRLACSILVNKLVFYEALRKAYGLRALTVPKTIRTAEELRLRLQRHFDQVRDDIDYESIFTEELIDRIPYATDNAVELWRDLIRDIERFDFTRLDYEVIGNIFQRLIAPDERHKLGQYFTPSRVVDLINSFCIRSANAKVFDPGCGAGTFLVRAYHLERLMNPDEPHESRLRRFWGADIARYAAHLSVINLATRDLSSTENYPRVIHDDFFNIVPRASKYPFHARIHRGPGIRTEQILEPVPMFDAVVGNPPYTRQEEMEDLFHGLADRAHAQVYGDWRVEISRRTGIHGLFLLHGGAFLEEGGRLGFLTHSSWMDVDYGRDIQRFLLERFKVVTIIEPQVEHWFPGVDVNTSIVVVERCNDAAARESNLVRFVQVKVPLAELVREVAGDPDDVASFGHLARAVESATRQVEDRVWRILPIRQKELWQEGIDTAGRYVGGKWSAYLRAPDVFFTIRQRAGRRLVPLSSVVDVRFGIKSGANEFFYVRDITSTLNAQQLATVGVSPREVDRRRVVESDDGNRHIIEAKYLHPVLTTTRHVDRLYVQPAWVTHQIVIATGPKHGLPRDVRRYIHLGETRPFGTSRRSGIPARNLSCRHRTPWYAIESHNRAPLLWFRNLTNIHVVPRNPELIYADQRFCNLTPRSPNTDGVIFGLLNSTFTFLCAEVYGRQFAGRGMDSVDITVFEIEKIPIVDPTTIAPTLADEIRQAIADLARRPILVMPDELERPDRRKLDDLVLQAMGINDADDRNTLLEELYGAVRKRINIRRTRALSTRDLGTGGRQQASAAALAAELAAEIDPTSIRRFPADFVPSGARSFVVKVPDVGDSFVRETLDTLRFGRRRLTLRSGEAAEFVELALFSGAQGEVRVPGSAQVLRDVLQAYYDYVANLERTISALAESRTRDRKLQRQVCDVLRSQLNISRAASRPQLRLI